MTDDRYSDIPYLRDLRGELVRAAGRHNRRRRRRVVAARGATLVAAVAAAAIAGLTLFGAGGAHTDSANAAVLRRVAAALAPRSGTILHERALVTIPGQAQGQYELWQKVDTPFAYRVIKFGHEASWDGSVLASYNADANAIVLQTGSPVSDPAYAPDDYAAELRALVQSGRAKIDQQTMFNGVPAYRLTVTEAPSRFLNGTVYVNRSDYHPLEIQTTLQSKGKTCPCIRETIDFQAYEYLPANAANTKLLDLHAQHPGARIVSPPSTATTTTG